VNVAELVFGSLSALGGLGGFGTLFLSIRDRTKRDHEADTRRDAAINGLTTEVRELKDRLVKVDGDGGASLLDRNSLNLRVGALEKTVGEAIHDGRETRDRVIAMEAANTVAHKAVQDGQARLELLVGALQSQIRMFVTGGADQAIEIRRAGRDR